MSAATSQLTRLCLIAGAGVALATVSRWLLDPFLGDAFPFYTYVITVTIIAGLNGWRTAAAALVVGYPIAHYLFVARGASFLADQPDFAGAVIYFLVGSVVIVILDHMRTAQQQAEKNATLAVQREASFQNEAAQRRRFEEELQLREQQLSALVENSPDVIGRLDRNLRHLYISARVQQFTALPPEHFIGKTGLEAGLPQAGWLPFQACCQRAFDSGKPVLHEFSLDTPQGERQFESRLIPERQADGAIASLLLITSDITERRQMQNALQSSEERLRLAVEAACAGILEWDMPSGRMTWSKRLFQILGYGEESCEPSYEHWQARVHPDDLPLVESLRERALIERRDWNAEYRLRLPGGVVRHVRMCGRFRWQEDGFPAWASAIFFDITAAKESESALVESEREFRTLFHLSGVGQVQADPDNGRILRANRRFCEITGFSENELKLMSFLELTHVEDRAENLRAWKRLITRQDPEIDMEKRYIRKDGVVIWVHVTATLVYDECGKPIHTATVVQDITLRKLAEEESQRLNTQLAIADRRKDEFLAILAHELRNPLAPIRNTLEIIKRNSGGPLFEQHCLVMERQVRQMVRLIDDLLDLSRITQNKLQLHREKISVESVVQQAIESCRPFIDDRGHRLTLTLPPEPIWIDGDPLRLTQVLCNLLTNASKYSEPNGCIQLSAECRGKEVLLKVRDSGIGIPQDMLSRVFEMFTQVEQSLERSQGGLGIGLALTKHLIQMHGGSISAHSAGPGTGSEFVVRLPRSTIHTKRTEPMNSINQLRSSSPRQRILVVDDNRDAADSLALLLQLGENEVFTAHDGHEAYEAADRYRPAVILLDIGLPRMNGHEVARRIRQQDWGKNIRLIAVTGWGQEEDRRLTAEAGFDHHLVKPVDPMRLMALLSPMQ